MSLDLFARALHLIGAIVWVGGLVAVALVAVFAAGDRSAVQAARRVTRSVVTPAMLLTWLGGLAVLVPGWATLYSKAGWMHGKLTLVLVATGLTGVVTGRLRRAAKGDKPAAPRALTGLALGLLLSAILIVGLAVVRPGGP